MSDGQDNIISEIQTIQGLIVIRQIDFGVTYDGNDLIPGDFVYLSDWMIYDKPDTLQGVVFRTGIIVDKNGKHALLHFPFAFESPLFSEDINKGYRECLKG